jgi:hypothetical protein
LAEKVTGLAMQVDAGCTVLPRFNPNPVM